MPPDPTVLAFDTSAAHCAAALLRRGEIIATAHEDMARGQGERLLPLLEEMLKNARLDWSDLDRIGVGIGPGNFTGIRISVSAARGLALGLGIPAIGVSLFDTTQVLGNCAQTTVPAPRDQLYFFDPDRHHKPVLIAQPPDVLVASSADYSPLDHVAEMARIAAQRPILLGERPVPLYVRPADAAPSKETGPVILP